MSYSVSLNTSEYERLHDQKYVIKITNDETGESAISSCTDSTLNIKIKKLKASLEN